MNQTVLFEMEFMLLVLFSVVVPVCIYGFLYKKLAISRWTVVAFAILLLIIAGIDVFLLQSLSAKAKATESQIDATLFLGQLSLALYLLPAAFAGLGVNLLTHILVNHLNEAELVFDKMHEASDGSGKNNALQRPKSSRAREEVSELWVLTGSGIATLAIFVLDIWTGAEIRLHVLYIFPLAMVARNCGKLTITIVTLLIVTVLQIITFSLDAVSLSPFIFDVMVAVSAALLIVFLARAARNKYLVALELAETDPLTSLANRRAFLLDVDSEIARQRRYGGIFTLAVLDLDGFKAVNDSRGHAAGDEVLKLLATILRTSLRGSDSIGRLGGDEFAILLPNTADTDCAEMLHKLCAGVAKRMADGGFAITVSIGCKTFRGPPDSTAQALQQADEIMYEAKCNGKNRVEFA